MVRNAFVDETSEATPDGRLWPRPMQLLMDEGDACFTVYHIPHSGTRNQNGTESRKVREQLADHAKAMLDA